MSLRSFYRSIVLLILLLSCDAHACSRPVRLAMMKWPPYFYSDEQGKPVGADIEILRAIFQEAGCQLEFVDELPRKRRWAMFMAGELDMIPGSSDTRERREFAWFSLPYRMETVSFFALKERGDELALVGGFDDIVARRISLLSLNSGWFGSAYDKHFATLTRNRQIAHFEAFPQGLAMLSKGRGDLIMADRATLIYEAARLKIDIVPLARNISQAPVHMMFSKKSILKSDMDLLNAAISRLERNGKLRSIREHCGI